MPRVFFGNFDCEYDWSAANRLDFGRPALPESVDIASHRTPKNRAGRRAAQYSDALVPAWLAIAEAEDCVLTNVPLAAEDFHDLCRSAGTIPRFVAQQHDIADLSQREFVPWGWTIEALQMAQRFGARILGPDPAIVAHVNSRQFRFELETALGIAIPGSRLIDSSAEFEPALRALPQPEAGWILKANFGMSGREAIRGRGPVPSEAQIRFLQSRLPHSGPLVLEPLLRPVCEAGIQWDIPRDGPLRLMGVAEQIVVGGSWRGSRFSDRNDSPGDWGDAIEITREVANRVQRAGYWGPLGLDSMKYEMANGSQNLRGLQDLNARFTMGRLALGWLRITPPGWCGSWLSIPNPTPVANDELRKRLDSVERGWNGHVRVLVTSPQSQTTAASGRTTVLIQAETNAIRSGVEARLLALE
ncbi:MAG: hypothetical protein NT069_19980 [Planctomycetota bacterium]|nr:hypothetical protein [Planctomycetota bacterium]